MMKRVVGLLNNMSHRNSILNDKITHSKLDNLSNNLTNGNQKVMMMGNTSIDGTGDSHHLHIDTGGNAKTIVTNAVYTLPHSETNSGITDDPRDSVAVGLRGRTDIALANTETFLKCENSGSLNTHITNQPNIKLEDLSSSLNAQHASGTARSMAVSLKATTDINDVPNNSKFLKCESSGSLIVSNGFTRSAMQTLYSNTFVAASGTSSSIDLDGYKGISIYGVLSSSNPCYVSVSGDDSNFFTDVSNMAVSVTGSNNEFFESYENLPRYVRILNDISGNNFTLYYNLYK